MIITLTQLEKEHDTNKLHDAFIAATLVPTHVESDASESRFTFTDGTDEGDIQDVIDAYTFAPPPAPANRGPVWTATVTIDLEDATPEINAEFPASFQCLHIFAARPSGNLGDVNPGGGINVTIETAAGVLLVDGIDLTSIGYSGGEDLSLLLYAPAIGTAGAIQTAPPAVTLSGLATGPATIDLVFVALDFTA